MLESKWYRAQCMTSAHLVTRNEILSDSTSQLGQMQSKLRDAGLLRPADFPSSLEDTEALRYEHCRDYGFLLLPRSMHKHWHNLLSAEFEVDIPYVDAASDTTDEDSDLDIQLIAFQDRVFQKLCSLWTWGKRDQKHPISYQKFVQAYHAHRNQNFRTLSPVPDSKS